MSIDARDALMVATRGGAARCFPARLESRANLAPKNRRLARNSRLGDDGVVTSLGNPDHRVGVEP
jgi:hypothetical protein